MNTILNTNEIRREDEGSFSQTTVNNLIKNISDLNNNMMLILDKVNIIERKLDDVTHRVNDLEREEQRETIEQTPATLTGSYTTPTVPIDNQSVHPPLSVPDGEFSNLLIPYTSNVQSNILPNLHLDKEMLTDSDIQDILAWGSAVTGDPQIRDAIPYLQKYVTGAPNTWAAKVVDWIGQLIYGQNNYIGPQKTGNVPGNIIDIVKTVPATSTEDAAARAHDILTTVSGHPAVHDALGDTMMKTAQVAAPAFIDPPKKLTADDIIITSVPITNYRPYVPDPLPPLVHDELKRNVMQDPRRAAMARHLRLMRAGDVEPNPGWDQGAGFNTNMILTAEALRQIVNRSEMRREMTPGHLQWNGNTALNLVADINYRIWSTANPLLALQANPLFVQWEAEHIYERIERIENLPIVWQMLGYEGRFINKYEALLEYMRLKLLLAGDVEQNPGPRYQYCSADAMGELDRCLTSPFSDSYSSYADTNPKVIMQNFFEQYLATIAAMRSNVDDRTDLCMFADNWLTLSGTGAEDTVGTAILPNNPVPYAWRYEKVNSHPDPEPMVWGALGAGLNGAAASFSEFMAVMRTTANTVVGDNLLNFSVRTLTTNYGNFDTAAKLLCYLHVFSEIGGGSQCDAVRLDCVTQLRAWAGLPNPNSYYPFSLNVPFGGGMPAIDAIALSATGYRDRLVGDTAWVPGFGPDRDDVAYIVLNPGQYSPDIITALVVCALEFPIADLQMLGSITASTAGNGIPAVVNCQRRMESTRTYIPGARQKVCFLTMDNNIIQIPLNDGFGANAVAVPIDGAAAVAITGTVTNFVVNWMLGANQVRNVQNLQNAFNYLCKTMSTTDLKCAYSMAASMIFHKQNATNIGYTAASTRGLWASAAIIAAGLPINGWVVQTMASTTAALGGANSFVAQALETGVYNMYGIREVTYPNNAPATTMRFTRSSPLTRYCTAMGILKYKDPLNQSWPESAWRAGVSAFFVRMWQYADIYFNMTDKFFKSWGCTNGMAFRRAGDPSPTMRAGLIQKAHNSELIKHMTKHYGRPFIWMVQRPDHTTAADIPAVLPNVPGWSYLGDTVYWTISLYNEWRDVTKHQTNEVVIEPLPQFVGGMKGKVYPSRTAPWAIANIASNGQNTVRYATDEVFSDGEKLFAEASKSYFTTRCITLFNNVGVTQSVSSFHLLESSNTPVWQRMPIVAAKGHLWWSSGQSVSDTYRSGRPCYSIVTPHQPMTFDPQSAERLTLGFSSASILAGPLTGMSLVGYGSSNYSLAIMATTVMEKKLATASDINFL